MKKAVKLGRPKVTSEKQVMALRKRGFSLSQMAAHFKVSAGAIQAAIRRAQKK